MGIPLMLNLGENLTEYDKNTADHRALCQLVNTEFPVDRLNGHKPSRVSLSGTQVGYHGSFKRTHLIDSAGQIHTVVIQRVHCPFCKQTWSVYPSLLVPPKHHDAYSVQNVLEDVLRHEMTYRATIRQNHQLTSAGIAKPNQATDARTPWEWHPVGTHWLGQLALPLVLIAAGLVSPAYAVEDQKFLSQNGDKSYVLGLVDPRYDLLWWLDYIAATAQTAIETSLRHFLEEVWSQTGQVHGFAGITGDDGAVARNAFAAITPSTVLAQCLLHPLLKFQSVVATFARLTKTTIQRLSELKSAFCGVLLAPEQAVWDERLAVLRQLPEFAPPLLRERVDSLHQNALSLTLSFICTLYSRHPVSTRWRLGGRRNLLIQVRGSSLRSE